MDQLRYWCMHYAPNFHVDNNYIIFFILDNFPYIFLYHLFWHGRLWSDMKPTSMCDMLVHGFFLFFTPRTFQVNIRSWYWELQYSWCLFSLCVIIYIYHTVNPSSVVPTAVYITLLGQVTRGLNKRNLYISAMHNDIFEPRPLSSAESEGAYLESSV